MLFLDNARVYRFDRERRRFVCGRNVLIDEGRIAGIDIDPSGLRVERVDLDGAVLLPAFADCHVHLAQTGACTGPRSLAAVDSYAAFEHAIARIPSEFGMVYAAGYDDAAWSDGRSAGAGPLDRLHPDDVAMIVRVDGHSSIVNRATLRWLDLPADVDGIERAADGAPTGRLFLDANWRAQALVAQRTPIDVQRANARRAADARAVRHDRPSAKGTHHFIEHFEMALPAHVDACAGMQLHLSMQPQFHATWGAPGGMYDERLGTQRRRAMNPMRALVEAGALVCGGSDAPVCALDPLAGMHAACTAQEPESCLDPHAALALYTINAAGFARESHERGNIERGLRADLVVLDRDPLSGVPFGDCSVMRTFVGGV